MRLLFVLFIAGCSDAALEQRIVQLEAKQALLVEENAALEKRLEELSSRRSTPSVPRTPSPAPEPIVGVLRVGDSETHIERKVLDAYLGDSPERSVRALPHKDAAGEIDGFRVSAIRRSSMPSALGIKNGDVIHSVNGQSLTGMTEMMVAYTAVRDSDQLNLAITRRGAKMTLAIHVVDTLPRQPHPE